MFTKDYCLLASSGQNQKNTILLDRDVFFVDFAFHRRRPIDLIIFKNS